MSTPTEEKTTTRDRSLPPWVIAIAFLALLAFLVVIGMGLRRAQSGPIVIGQAVPNFIVQSFEGEEYATGELRGKVIVINFWASWCKPCEQEAFELESAYQFYKDRGDVVFLGIDYVDTEPEALGFINQFGLTYPNGPDLGTKVSQMFRITGVPETYIIDQAGKLAFVKKGPFESLAEIQSAVDALLE